MFVRLLISQATYVGGVENGHRHGEGVFVDPSVPCLYEGGWVRGLREGLGTLRYNDAGTHFYRGMWTAGARHGHGLLRYASGNTYEGQWVWDRKVGHGTMTWLDLNQLYRGEWRNDKPHGVGEYTWMDLPVAGAAAAAGAALAAQNQAQQNTPAKELTARGAAAAAAAALSARSHHSSGLSDRTSNGVALAPLATHFQHPNRYHGEWVAGVREGVGTFFYATGALYQGAWHNDLKHGPASFTFPNGSTHQGNFVDDHMQDNAKWNHPYSGVVEQMQATASASAGTAAATGAGTQRSLKTGGGGGGVGRAPPVALGTTAKDVGMFDLPLDDLLASHAAEFLGAQATPAATQAYISAQKEQLANMLLRFNTELLDIYRFYSAQTHVDLSNPAAAPAASTFASASSSGPGATPGSRLNLGQLWLLFGDLELVGHPALEHCADLSLAALDRVLFSRMLLHASTNAGVGGESGADNAAAAATAAVAHANRLLLPDLSSVHDPRQVLLVRDFLEGLIRISAALFKGEPATPHANGLALSQEERDLAREEAELAKAHTDGEEAQAAVSVSPAALYARAQQNFNQLLTTGSVSAGVSAVPGSDLSLGLPLPLAVPPLHALSGLTNANANAGASPSSIGGSGSMLALGSSAYFGGGSSSSAGALASAKSASTLVDRFKHFLTEFVLPRAGRRSKHAFSGSGGGGGGGAFGSPGCSSSSFIVPQPLYKLPALVALAKSYERDLYAQVFLPCSSQSVIVAAAEASSSSSSSSSFLLPPLSDRTVRLSSLLRMMQRTPGVFGGDSSSSGSSTGGSGSYFTLYHCLDMLYGREASAALGEGLLLDGGGVGGGVELLFPEMVQVVLKVGLWRGRVLAEVAASLARERAAIDRIVAERRMAQEAGALAAATVEAAAPEEAGAGAAGGGGGGGGGGKGSSGGGGGGGGKHAPLGKSPSNPSLSKSSSAASLKGAPASKARVGSAKKSSQSQSPQPQPQQQQSSATSTSPRSGAASKKETAAAAHASSSSKNGKGKRASVIGSTSAAAAPAPAAVAAAAAAAAVPSLHALPSSAAATGSSFGALAGLGLGLSLGGLGGGESGSLARKAIVLPDLERLSLQQQQQQQQQPSHGNGSPSSSSASAWSSVSDFDAAGWLGDAEDFICRLLGRPVPVTAQTTFPHFMREDGLQICN